MYPIITSDVNIQPIISNAMNQSGPFRSTGNKVSADTQDKKVKPTKNAEISVPSSPYTAHERIKLSTNTT
jgi:hypothetical protein